MRFFDLVSVIGLTSAVAARNPMHVGQPYDFLHQMRSPHSQMMHGEPEKPRQAFPKRSVPPEYQYHKRAGPTLIKQNSNTTKYAVDGTGLPDVDFDIGESYAGLLPISDEKDEERQLYFWFFPSSNPAAEDEITIWLNGGPGCSSLEGLFQENGPFIWQYGTFKPVANPWTWVKLTNMLWVEQPVGTGFSQGKPTATNEEQVASQFLGFFKRFIDQFGLHNKKIYVTGESYAGYYVPYIADAMLDSGDKEYNNLQGILIYDPSTSTSAVQNQIPAVPFLESQSNLMIYNKTYKADLIRRDRECGYAAFREKYFTFPPRGKLPTPPGIDVQAGDECDTFNRAFYGALDQNPCFDIYQVATTCPLLYDVLGFPGSIPYHPKGAPKNYFNRKAVQKAINAPIEYWAECSNGVLNVDTSMPSGLSVLPGVISRTNNVIIAHGQLDMVLIANGTLLMIQNMTWNGKQGFQKAPSKPFYVPFHTPGPLATLAGAGLFGTTTTERGLTWVEVFLSGHMVPQYAPSASYRHVEKLLGRIPSLSSRVPFTTDPFA